MEKERKDIFMEKGIKIIICKERTGNKLSFVSFYNFLIFLEGGGGILVQEF